VGTVQQRFEIERPLAAVYDALSQPQAILESLPGVITVNRLSEDKYRVTTTRGATEVDVEITSRVPPRHIDWRTADGAWSGSVDLESLASNRTAVAVAADGSSAGDRAASASTVHEALQALKRTLQQPQVEVSVGGASARSWAGSDHVRRYASEWRETAQSALARPTEFPFKLMRTLSRQMDRIWGDVMAGTPISRLPHMLPGLPWHPDVEVCEQDDQVRVCIDVPGIDEAHLQVEIDRGTLVVRGERQDERASDPGRRRTELHYGAFTRRIPLPEGIDSDSARAVLRNGVLEVRIPLHRREPHRVPVQHTG
jgi:HSP20 family protein